MNDFLKKILDYKKKDIDVLYREKGIPFFEHKKYEGHSYSFYGALSSSSLSLIAEIKKASPSRGLINPNFSPKLLAKSFKESGASALSVLTEPHFFQGDPSYIHIAKTESGLPVLRKDFFIDPIQVYEAKSLGADAILLILAVLDQSLAKQLHSLAYELGLDVLVEVHNAEEFERALDIEGVRIIGVNNRNLTTFDLDNQLASNLKKVYGHRLSSEQLLVAESGYFEGAQMISLSEADFSAVLIGEGLVKNPDLIGFFQ